MTWFENPFYEGCLAGAGLVFVILFPACFICYDLGEQRALKAEQRADWILEHLVKANK